MPSAVRGVGSRPCEDEDTLPAVGRPDLSGGYKRPFRIEPEAGQVGEYSAACPQNRFVSAVSHAPRAGFQVAIGSKGQQSSHVLKQHERRTERADRRGHMCPYACPVPGPQAPACSGAAHVLAREPGGQDLHRFCCAPLRRRDITQVGYAGEAMREDS
jgi:hypothetical protein